MFKKTLDTFKYMFLDVIAISLSYIFALLALNRFGYSFDAILVFQVATIIIILKILIFALFRVYDIIPKYIGFDEIFTISLISFLSNLSVVIVISIIRFEFIFRTAFYVIAPIEMILLSFHRIIYRISNYFKTSNKLLRSIGKKTIIVGAGQACEMVIKEIKRNAELDLFPVGILDDDEKKIGSRINGIKILGKINEINEYVVEYRATDVIIAIKDLNPKKTQELFDSLKNQNVKVQKLLEISEAKEKPILKTLNIEDLLNREKIELDNSGIEDVLSDETILVTGGGGSIGSELVRQVTHFRPKKIIIFDIYENNAYDIQMEIQRSFQKKGIEIPFDLKVIIGSVYNLSTVEKIFNEYNPTIIFHAAAYKHVPLMEENYIECIRTNVIGTYNMIKTADKFNAKQMTIISTDKAVRSTNIMGASKRLAEKIMQSYKAKSSIIFSAVRFGNVLNSNGSVIPLFMKQIQDGGPVNVTHKEITRYFMTIPEAVSLILQSMIYTKGQDIFVLDMGEPVKIYELAENMIRLSGLKPHEEIKIDIIGLRPGEKLYEELLINNEFISKTQNGKIFKEEKPFEEITFSDNEIPDLEKTTKKEIINFLLSKVTSYNPKDFN